MIENAGGIICHKGKIVLVEQQGNSWCFPKGGMEHGETPLETAKREIREETGIQDLLLVEDLGTYERRSHNRDATGEDMSRPPIVRQVFLFTTGQDTFTIDGNEITQARFVDLDEALALLTHPKDKAFIASRRDRIEACLKQHS